MVKPTLTPEVRQALREHYAAIAALQKEHGVTPKDGICTHYPYGDDHLLVQADGAGGGDLVLVCDRFPFDDHLQHYCHHFDNEDEACRAAEWFDTELEENGSTMSAMEFFSLLEEGKKPWLEEASE